MTIAREIRFAAITHDLVIFLELLQHKALRGSAPSLSTHLPGQNLYPSHSSPQPLAPHGLQ